MLPPADERIVERDTALPGLRLVLDPEALATALSRPPMDCVYLRYKPGKTCVGAFIMPGKGLEAVAVIASTPARFAEFRSRSEWYAGTDPARFLEDACVVEVPLARDRALKGARLIADHTRGAALLHKLTGDGRPVDPVILRYKPGRRLVLRAGDALIKAYSKGAYAAAKEGALIAEELGGAPLIGMSDRHRCLAWDWLDGASLCPEAGGVPELPAWRAAGLALARVHGASVRPAARVTRADDLSRLAALAPDLSPLDPDLARAAGGLAGKLATELSGTSFVPGLIHGDFSADQVLVRGDTATLIDWDAAATGDPARDLGSFLAQLDAQAVDGILSRKDSDAAAASFLDGYAGASGPLDTRAVALQRVRALLALLPEGFRHRRPDWPERARRLIALADDLLATPPSPTSRKARDREMPLDKALDPTAMAPLVEEALKQRVCTLEARLVRHKPGRRALIRYRVGLDADAAPLVLLGKLRAKGPDGRTPALHAALRQAGLDGRAPASVGVPEARGTIAAPALWLQDEVPGCQFTTLLQPGADTGPAARTGAALARLHATRVPTDRAWSMEDELGVLTRALSAARQHLPHEAARLGRIARRAEALLRSLGPGMTTGIHRDFYPDQVLIDAGRVWLLDLDLYAQGDPSIDLGNFLAHLDEHGLRHHGDAAALAEHGSAFLDGYASVRPLDNRRVAALRLVSLARHINLSRNIAGRGHTTLSIIDHCAARLDVATGTEERLEAVSDDV